MTPDARALHERLFTIDTHCDTPTASLTRAGWDFAARHDHALDPSQVDLPRLGEGGMDAMVFAVYVGQMARTPAAWRVVHERALRCFERTRAVLAANPSACALALTAEEALALKAQGRRAIFLSVENAYSLGHDAANVAKFHALGVRLLGLTHMLNNELADSATDPRGAEWGGLSPFGREVVAECNRLGIALDASHASDAALRDLLEASRAPVVLSHSGPRACADHPRNVGDELLRELARRGGVLHLNALPISLVHAPGNRRTQACAEAMLRFRDTAPTPAALAAEGRDCDAACAAWPSPRATLGDLVRQIEHTVAVAGIDHAGIGCDLDGGGGGFEGLRDAADYPNITAALAASGWKEDALAKLWGGNTLRVLRAAGRPAEVFRVR